MASGDDKLGAPRLAVDVACSFVATGAAAAIAQTTSAILALLLLEILNLFQQLLLAARSFHLHRAN